MTTYYAVGVRSSSHVRLAVAVAFVLSIIAAACGGGEASESGGRSDLDPALGGDATRAGGDGNAFGMAVDGLTEDQQRRFDLGNSFFSQNWVTDSASTENATGGLGPTFNAQACVSCHVRDGRGAPPFGPEDDTTRGLLLRLSIPASAGSASAEGDPLPGVPGEAVGGSPVPDPVYGGQLQDRAVAGVPPEGRMEVTWVSEAGEYDDGTAFELRYPEIEIVDLAFGPLVDSIMISPRLAPQVFGVGLLEAVPEGALRDLADPDDADGDGISGRVNLVPDPRTGELLVGRFGWKANAATVEAQVAGAFHADMGITSTLAPDENCSAVQKECVEAAGADSADPVNGVDIDDERLDHVTFYNRTLAVPSMRDHDQPDVRAGAELFEEIGCASCHVPTLRTGDADVAQLANQTIHPYTDLLLHDMGQGLADGRSDFEANGSEWRTPPLWGIGLIDDVNMERFLLHDGRARSIPEAILWHGGEAQGARDRFAALGKAERIRLLAFLESL